ncbi:MAG: histidine phosphatase family protein [Chlamydiota bacterium]
MNEPNLLVFLCRHGETAWTLSGQHTGSTDLSLTEKGKTQALELGKQLQKIHFARIFTSPLKRAKETCIFAGFERRLEEDPHLVEWNYGNYEGLTSQEIRAKHPTWDLFTQGAPGGESSSTVGHRADQFIQTLLKQNGKVVVFSHGHFLRVLAARWIGLMPEMGKAFSLSVASLGILGFEADLPAIKLWNNSFLIT